MAKLRMAGQELPDDCGSRGDILRSLKSKEIVHGESNLETVSFVFASQRVPSRGHKVCSDAQGQQRDHF